MVGNTTNYKIKPEGERLGYHGQKKIRVMNHFKDRSVNNLLEVKAKLRELSNNKVATIRINRKFDDVVSVIKVIDNINEILKSKGVVFRGGFQYYKGERI